MGRDDLPALGGLGDDLVARLRRELESEALRRADARCIRIWRLRVVAWVALVVAPAMALGAFVELPWGLFAAGAWSLIVGQLGPRP